MLHNLSSGVGWGDYDHDSYRIYFHIDNWGVFPAIMLPIPVSSKQKEKQKQNFNIIAFL